jgi:hypothetical protein
MNRISNFHIASSVKKEEMIVIRTNINNNPIQLHRGRRTVGTLNDFGIPSSPSCQENAPNPTSSTAHAILEAQTSSGLTSLKKSPPPSAKRLVASLIAVCHNGKKLLSLKGLQIRATIQYDAS